MADLPTTTSYTLVRTQPIIRSPKLLRHAATQTINNQSRNINLIVIDYAFRPRLRSRLTQRGRACRWKP